MEKSDHAVKIGPLSEAEKKFLFAYGLTLAQYAQLTCREQGLVTAMGPISTPHVRRIALDVIDDLLRGNCRSPLLETDKSPAFKALASILVTQALRDGEGFVVNAALGPAAVLGAGDERIRAALKQVASRDFPDTTAPNGTQIIGKAMNERAQAILNKNLNRV